MPALNWGLISDGGVFESLMHAILYAQNPNTILFGRPGKDAGQDARSSDGATVYQAKYRKTLDMDGAISEAKKELKKITSYRESSHANFCHWKHAKHWVLVANMSVNPNDEAKWRNKVVPVFEKEGLVAEYWGIDALEGNLAKHPEVSDVFFGGENRVLVGLKEAHDLLAAACIGSLSLDLPMIGRCNELDQIKTFANTDDNRILPIIGPGGIGKSRLIYESLVTLAHDGWRVLWALPSTMSKSSQWFRLLNGMQKTCMVLDDLTDPDLLKAVVEQLTPVERCNWRAIVAFRTEKADVLNQYKTHQLVASPLTLPPLDELNSHDLMNALLDTKAMPAKLHSVFKFTLGVPGWLSLIAELVKQQKLSSLPDRVDYVAELYVESCLDAIGHEYKEQGKILLRWLALWGNLRLEAGPNEKLTDFLKQRGVLHQPFRELLDRFVSTKLIMNWGIGKRYYAVEPLIVRQYILSDWLLTQDNGAYVASHAGKQVISDLLEGNIPFLESVLQTLSQLTLSRLDESNTLNFLGPVFKEMAAVTVYGDLQAQSQLTTLVEKVGIADPEGTLEILTEIRQNPKPDYEINNAVWGSHTLVHSEVLARFPWILFQTAEQVKDATLARRYIEEFRHLVALEDADTVQFEAGKGPRQLLGRILCHPKYGTVFAPPSHDVAIKELGLPESWPFVGLLCKFLLNPIHESIDRVSRGITCSSHTIAPGSDAWNLAISARNKVITLLQNSTEHEIRTPLWHVLAESHRSFRSKARGGDINHYNTVLIDDLKACISILESPPINIGIAEATRARNLWKWYLEYSKDQKLVDLSKQCEMHYDKLSNWQLKNFFQRNQALETKRVAGLLRAATSTDTFTEFFEEAACFLKGAAEGTQHTASQCITALAVSLIDMFQLYCPDANALSTFVVNVLSGNLLPKNCQAWWFAVTICQRHLCNVKKQDENAVEELLNKCLNLTSNKGQFLFDLYRNVHPASTGTITHPELNAVLKHQAEYNMRNFFYLLGSFASVDIQNIQACIQDKLESMRNNAREASQCMSRFIIAAEVTALRYKWTKKQAPIRWIIDMILNYNLDGELLGMHELEYLRDCAKYRLSIDQTVKLLQSRFALASYEQPYAEFEIIPFEFNIQGWCHFDDSDPKECEAFNKLCEMILDGRYTALHWLPKYLMQINPAGKHVGAFVASYLKSHSDLETKELSRLGCLASAFPDESEAWSDIASLICTRANLLNRKDRYQIYSGLVSKEIEAISCTLGEVPKHYIHMRDKADDLLQAEPDNSPLYEYRKWALQCAEERLGIEKGFAEEDIKD